MQQLISGCKLTTYAEYNEITKEKMGEIYDLIPFFVNELNIAEYDKQKQHYSTGGDDQAKLKFKNGSQIDIVSTTDAARGGRKTLAPLAPR